MDKKKLMMIGAAVVAVLVVLAVVGYFAGFFGASTPDVIAVRIGEKWGFIDHTGKYVINPQFDSVSGNRSSLFMDGYDEDDRYGLIAVRSGDKWGYVDKKGTFVITPQFDRANGFDPDTGLAEVSIGGKSMSLNVASGSNSLQNIRDAINKSSDNPGVTASIITGTGFPKVFYLAYTLYRQYFPLLALSGYRRAMDRATNGAGG